MACNSIPEWRNNEFPQCDENVALDTRDKLAFLFKGRELFDKVFITHGYNLNTFTQWSSSGITRFTLRTSAANNAPDLIIDDDPSTIQYYSVSDFQRQFGMLPLINDLDTKHIGRLGDYRHVSLVETPKGKYVRKTIEDDRAESLKDWRNEFVLLTGLQDCPYTVDVRGLTTARNPYNPQGEDVVTAFLLEYGEKGTLKDFIGDIDEVYLQRWMLEVVKGLREMHRRGIIHGDLKPDNIIITESMRAKIIDFAQSGLTPQYHAPEFPELFESKDQWRPSIDIYSYGVIYWVLSGLTTDLPKLSNENLSPVTHLIAKCVAINPLDRPSAEGIIDILEPCL
jgi:serine/threonine protein kinase